MTNPSAPEPPKQPFRIGPALKKVRQAVRGYPRTALFELRDEGYGSIFEILVACIISIRTLDEITLPTARRLFARARTPAEVVALDVRDVAELIAPCQFAENKARQIHDIARTAVEQHGGTLPGDRDVLLSLHGVGPSLRQPGAGRYRRPAGHRRRYPRSSHHQSLGLRPHQNAGKDAGGAGGEVAAPLLGDDQRTARAVRQAHLPTHRAEVFGVSAAGDVCAGGGEEETLRRPKQDRDRCVC